MHATKLLGGLVLLAAIGWGSQRLWGSHAPVSAALPAASVAGLAAVPVAPPKPAAKVNAQHHGLADDKAAGDPARRLCQEILAGLGPTRDQAALKQHLAQARQQAREQLAAVIGQALSTSNLPERAAAHLLQAQLAAQSVIPVLERETPDCSHNVACVAKVRSAQAGIWASASSELAKLALASPDPALYAMAYHSCHHLNNQNHGFCQQISAQQWAQRDPTNGNAWLYVANQDLAKQTRGSANGPGNSEIDSAMLHMLQAQTFDQRTGALAKLANSRLFQSQSAPLRLELLRLFGDLNELGSLPPLYSVSRYCHPDQLNDSNRRQVCDKVANKLASDESNVLSARQAYEIGEKLGWPAARLQLRIPVYRDHPFRSIVTGHSDSS